jgi:hypothetical protein
MQVANQVFDMGEAVANAYIEDKINIANAEHRQVALDTMVFSEENQVLTQKQLKDLGILDRVETTDDAGNELELVPRHRWRAILMDHNVEESRYAQAENIKAPVARNAWSKAAKDADAQLVAKTTMQTARDAWEFEATQMQSRFERATKAGDWQVAQEVLDTQIYGDIFAANPELKKSMQLTIDRGIEMEYFSKRIMSSNEDDIQGVLEEMADPEQMKDSVLTSSEQRSMFNAAYARQQKLIAQEKQQADAVSSAISRDLEIEMTINPAGFDVGKIVANERYLNDADFGSLMGLYRSQSSGGSFSTPTAIQQSIESKAFDLENGYFSSEVGYFEAVDDLSREISDLAREGLISGTDINRYRERINSLQAAPSQNPAYKEQVEELKRLILQYDSDASFGFGPSDESSIEFQEAKNDLIAWVKQNGGPSADITEWRNSRLPKHLKKAAKASFYKLPKNSQKLVIERTDASGNVSIDAIATMENARANVAKVQAEYDAAKDLNKTRMQSKLEKAQDAVVDLETYFSGIGRFNVNR